MKLEQAEWEPATAFGVIRGSAHPQTDESVIRRATKAYRVRPDRCVQGVEQMTAATASADTPITRCRFYREVCQMPAFVVPGSGRISMRAGRIGAITLPAQLGAVVRQRLHTRRAQPGPVVSHLRSKRWTFLIVPNVPADDIRLFAELFRLNASVAPFGAEIALPSPADQRTSLRIWVHAPRDSYRPSGMSIIEAIRACAAPRPRQP